MYPPMNMTNKPVTVDEEKTEVVNVFFACLHWQPLFPHLSSCLEIGVVSMREGRWKDDVEWQDYGKEEAFNLYINFIVHMHQQSLLSVHT